MTTHFLYSYRDDGHDGRELRYSLRGLDTFWVGDFDVTIVGDCPDWVKGVVHVPTPRSSEKQMDILLNVLHGARRLSGVEGPVVCMDDDYVLLEPTSRVIQGNGGTFQAVYQNRNRLTEENFEWWLTALERTHDLLLTTTTRGWYERHRPFLIDPKQAVSLLRNFEGAAPVRAPFWRTVYGNFVGWDEPTYQMRDVRVSGSWPKGTSWVSTDQAYWDKAKTRLARWLPTPSRFER